MYESFERTFEIENASHDEEDFDGNEDLTEVLVQLKFETNIATDAMFYTAYPGKILQLIQIKLQNK